MEIINLIKGDDAGRSVAAFKAAQVLLRGGVVMHETETCYGLAADILNSEAVSKVYRIKGMERSKPVSIMVRDLEEARKYGKFDDLSLRLAEKFWPGPLTIVVPRGENLPEFLNEGNGFVGIRCPDSELASLMLREFGGALTTTSANVSGVAQVYDVMSFLNQVRDREDLPDLIVDSGMIVENPPSTIVRVESGRVEFLRTGALENEVRKMIE